MKKNALLQTAALAMAAAVTLSACGGGTNALPGQASSSQPAAPAQVENGMATTASGLKINLESLPIVTEPVNLKFACLGSSSQTVPYEEMSVVKKFMADTGVNIEWEVIDAASKDEKTNLLFSSNELPDAFYGANMLTDAQISMFSQTGSLIKLNDLIENYAPSLKALLAERTDYKNAISDKDGNIYGLASLIEEERNYASQHMFINKKWLDKLGLAVPTTTDELYTVLKAFKEKDPNGNGKADEIPFSLTEKFFGLGTLFGSFGLPDFSSPTDPNSHFSVQDSKVIYNAIQPQYKEAIQYFHKLYAEGLIDPELFTQEFSQLKSKGNDPSVILGMTLVFWPDDTFPKEIQDQYVHLLPLKGPNGDQLLARDSSSPVGLARNSFMITSKNQNPELTIRVADAMTDEETTLSFLHGERGVSWDYTDGKVGGEYATWPDKTPEGMTFDQFRGRLCPSAASFYLIPKDMADRRVLDELNSAQQQRFKEYEPFLQPAENVFPSMYLSAEDQNKVSELGTDIRSYVDQMRAKWITEGGIENEWDEYVKKVQSLGVDEMTGIYTNYLPKK